MSGHKSAVVTISQEEYRRLYEAERNLYYENMEQTALAREQELEVQVRELANHIKERESHYLNLIQELDQGLRGIEQDSTQAILNEQIHYLNEIVFNQNKQLTLDQAEVDAREQAFTEIIDQLQHEIVSRFTELHDYIAAEQSNKKNVKQMARENYSAVLNLHAIIRQSYPGHICNFHEFDQKIHQIDLVELNIRNEADEAALSQSQSLYLSLSNHKKLCDIHYLEWQLLYNQVSSDLKALLDGFSTNQRIQPIDKNGQLLGDEIDTDYWTQGLFSELEKKVADMVSYINLKGQEVSYPELKTIMADFILPIQDMLIQCLMDARINALNAQIRYEIANTVLVALVEQGFKPVKGDYQDGSYFGSYQASALNSSGNQVDIFVEPGPTNNLENSLHVISQNHLLSTQDELHSRAREIRNSLIHHGLNVGVFSEIPAQPEENSPSIYRIQNQLVQGSNT